MAHPVYTLDLNFMNVPGTIASYLIPHRHGGVLVECGPGSTVEGLKAALADHGLTVGDISDVLVTHIHLDHAGAAGYLARQGATVHVHPVGAPHMIDPTKLLKSAGRIYGDMMDTLWGEFLPVPEDRLHVVQDGEELVIEGLRFLAVDTPGHAYHHHAYLFEDICFSGDIGGVRVAGYPAVRLPMPPPEFHLETWRASVQRLRELDFARIAPTHFGIYNDSQAHLDRVDAALDAVEAWMEAVMPTATDVVTLRDQFAAWAREQMLQGGLPEEVVDTHETANPSWMSADGLWRYWRKYRAKGTPA